MHIWRDQTGSFLHTTPSFQFITNAVESIFPIKHYIMRSVFVCVCVFVGCCVLHSMRLLSLCEFFWFLFSRNKSWNASIYLWYALKQEETATEDDQKTFSQSHGMSWCSSTSSADCNVLWLLLFFFFFGWKNPYAKEPTKWAFVFELSLSLSRCNDRSGD